MLWCIESPRQLDELCLELLHLLLLIADCFLSLCRLRIGDRILDDGIKLSLVLGLIVLLVELGVLLSLQGSPHIVLKILLLESFPSISEPLDAPESQQLFFLCVGSILTHCVHAHHILDFLGLEWSIFQLWPFFLLRSEVFSILFLLSPLLLLLLLEVSLLFVDLDSFLVNLLEVLHSCIKSIQEEARVILELNGEI